MMANRPPACPIPLSTASVVRSTTIPSLQVAFVSLELQPTSPSAIQGPATGMRRSRAFFASAQIYEVPTPTPYQPTVNAAPVISTRARVPSGGNSVG